MGDPIKKLLSVSISSLEQGAFQEFCLAFLPLYSDRFAGLERHGGTAEGKTRKGTPDLIKVNLNGSHICVQCSTEANYWNVPSDISDWKPIKDIIRCVEEIGNIDEIVLCASAEIPTTLSDAKSRIIGYAKTLTDSALTILSLSNFEEEMRGALDRYSQVVKRFCSDVYEYEVGFARKQAAEAKLRLYKTYPLPLSLIEQVVERRTKDAIGEVDVADIEAEIALLRPSRFLRENLPEPNVVIRASVNDFLAREFTAGTACALLGVPKIGKTSWVAQLCKKAVEDGLEICWFDSPDNRDQQVEFTQDIVRTVLGRITDPELANQYADKKIGIPEVTARLKISERKAKVLLVIDNAENIDPKAGAGIRNLFDLLGNPAAKTSVSVILISRKQLKPWLGDRIIEKLCPAWSIDEIEQLIYYGGVKITHRPKAYSELLTMTSGGHPLIALALARKAPNIVDLLTVKLKSAPALHDEDLTEEVKRLLFDDLLPNEDNRDLVLRLAPLFLRFDLELMAFVGSAIAPRLRTPVKLMLERLRGTVLEGDDATGYQVAFVFREVAVTMVSAEGKTEIYRKAAGFLLQPKGGVMDADRTLDGIWYAILGGELFWALFWTFRLLKVFDQPLTDFQREYTLARLAIVTALNPPSERGLKVLLYCFTLSSFAAVYAEAGDQSRSIRLVKKIVESPLTEEDVPDQFGLSHGTVNAILGFHAALSAARSGQEGISLALQIVNRLDAKALLGLTGTGFVTKEGFTEMVEGLHILIRVGSPSLFPFDFVRSLSMQLSTQDNLLGRLADWFCTLGWQASVEEHFDILKAIPEMKEESETFFGLLKKFAYAQYYLESGERTRALGYCVEIAQLISGLNIESNRLISKLMQIRGDTFYRGKEYDKAILEYQASLSAIRDDPNAFDYAWANHRLGVCIEDDNLAIQHLLVASASFERLNLLGMEAKSDGERAVAFYRKGEIKETVKILYGIADRYYLQGVKEYSAAATLALASLIGIEAKIKEEPFVEGLREGSWHPELKKRLFEGFSEEAGPRAGICVAYFKFADVFELLGDRDMEATALNRAFEGTASSAEETRIKIWAGLKIVSLLFEKGQEAEGRSVLSKLFETESKGGVFPESGWKYYIFTKAEEFLKQGKISRENFMALLNGVKEAVLSLPDQRKSWWLAEVKTRQAGIDGVTSENDYRGELLREALNVAKEARNYGVLVQVGHQISFVHYHRLDFKEIAEAQLAVITGVCNDGGEISRLQIVGENMFNFWVGISYNRLKESDLPYWLNLARRAKRMHKHSPGVVRAGLMISFLLIVTNAIGNEDCQRAVAWVTQQLSGEMEQVSEDDRGYLREFLGMD